MKKTKQSLSELWSLLRQCANSQQVWDLKEVVDRGCVVPFTHVRRDPRQNGPMRMHNPVAMTKIIQIETLHNYIMNLMQF